MFRYLKQRRCLKEKARTLYNEAVMQARLPVFYKDLGVPDSVDGRFEMVALHCYIIIHRLNKAENPKQAQALFDIFFINMDQSIREMGVGDVGVPKHMKRMMQGFNGRCEAYEKAVKNKDNKALEKALIRNVYGTLANPPSQDIRQTMERYVNLSCAMEATDAEFAVIDINQESVLHA